MLRPIIASGSILRVGVLKRTKCDYVQKFIENQANVWLDYKKLLKTRKSLNTENSLWTIKKYKTTDKPVTRWQEIYWNTCKSVTAEISLWQYKKLEEKQANQWLIFWKFTENMQIGDCRKQFYQETSTLIGWMVLFAMKKWFCVWLDWWGRPRAECHWGPSVT